MFHLAKTIYKYFLKREIIKRGEITQPIFISEDNIVFDGAHRLEISKELGIPLPVIIIPAKVMQIVNIEDKLKLKSWLNE